MKRGQRVSWRQNAATSGFNKIQPTQVHFPGEPCFCDACRMDVRCLEDPTFNCSSCEETFPRKNLLLHHIVQNHKVVRIRPTRKPYQCSICTKCFSRRDHASAHAKLHLLKNKRFSCDQCPLKFSWKSNLNAHKKRIHSSVRPLKCNVCQKWFLSRWELVNHHQTHSPKVIFKFKCLFCSKGIRRSDHLEVHIRSHLKEKPYICDHCQKEYAHLKSLKSHLRTRH